MPMLIDHIDKIARDKRRGVVYIEFCKQPDFNRRNFDEYRENLFIDYENLEIRETLLQWFADNRIAVYPCGPFARVGRAIRNRVAHRYAHPRCGRRALGMVEVDAEIGAEWLQCMVG